MMKHDWKLHLPWFSDGYWKCMFVDFLIEYIGPSNCVHHWVYWLIKFEDESNLFQ